MYISTFLQAIPEMGTLSLKRRMKTSKAPLQHLAKELFLSGQQPQKQIAAEVGISENTLGAWVKDGGWKQLRAAQQDASSEGIDHQQKRIQRARKDYAFFVHHYFHHYTTAPCAQFHIQAAHLARDHPNLRAVLLWARAHAKSTHCNVFIPLWLKIQVPRALNVLLLVGKSESNARRLLYDLQNELQYNERFLCDFGEQMRKGSWKGGYFATQDGCAFLALGRGQAPRGFHFKQNRPDYIVVDDLDDDELCRNPDRVRKLTDWVYEALLPTMKMGMGRFVLVGNLISKTSVIASLAANKSFRVLRVDALDPKTQKPSWRELYTPKNIQDMMDTMGYRRAQKELFNNPIIEGSIFKNEWITYATALPLEQYECLLSYCDPAFRHSKTSDYKAFVVVGKLPRKGYTVQYHIVHAFVRKCSVKAFVQHLYHYQSSLPEQVICQHYMEGGFIQDLLFDELVKEGAQRGWQLLIRKDHRKKPDKVARIEAISPLFERGLIQLAVDQQNDADMALLVEQLLAFEHGSNSHDDGPDALEGALYLLQKRSATINSSIYTEPRLSNRWY